MSVCAATRRSRSRRDETARHPPPLAQTRRTREGTRGGAQGEVSSVRESPIRMELRIVRDQSRSLRSRASLSFFRNRSTFRIGAGHEAGELFAFRCQQDDGGKSFDLVFLGQGSFFSFTSLSPFGKSSSTRMKFFEAASTNSFFEKTFFRMAMQGGHQSDPVNSTSTDFFSSWPFRRRLRDWWTIRRVLGIGGCGEGGECKSKRGEPGNCFHHALSVSSGGFIQKTWRRRWISV